MFENFSEDIVFDKKNLRKGALVLRAINHTLRQKILQLIDKNKKITVTEIYKALKLEQSVASQHLAILRSQRFVNTKRDGKKIFYSINQQRFKETETFMNSILKPLEVEVIK